MFLSVVMCGQLRQHWIDLTKSRFLSGGGGLSWPMVVRSSTRETAEAVVAGFISDQASNLGPNMLVYARGGGTENVGLAMVVIAHFIETHLLRHFILKLINSPRQARDKDRENSHKRTFSGVRDAALIPWRQAY
jgi:hypothetical protein